MLDLHTHILPGMDDGSKTPEQSIAMLESEVLQGVGTVVLTPHYLADQESPASFLQRRRAAEMQLQEAIWGRGDLPALVSGAEVAYFDGMCRCDNLEQLCIAGTNAMLIEMPFSKWSQRMLGELQELQQYRGIQPILAHVERYMTFQPFGLVEQMTEMGMLIQVNASFFLRWQTALRAMAMLKKRSIHFIGSDCHNMEHRAPNMCEVLRRIESRLGVEAIEYLMDNADTLFGGMK